MIRNKLTIFFIQTAATLAIIYFALTNYATISGGLASFLQDMNALRFVVFLYLNLIMPTALISTIYMAVKIPDQAIFAIVYSVITLTAIVVSVISIKKRLEIRIVPHNRKYLQDILATSGKDGRLYTISKRDLAKKILGRKSNSEELESVYNAIDEQIKPIKSFLKDEQQESSTLVINSKWGAGKTTSLLIAIDETKRIKRNDKFIYESAFRYSASMDEFIKDFLNTFSNVLFELGVDVRNDTDTLIKNYELSPTKTISNVLKSQNTATNLSIEIMAKINKMYEDEKKRNKIRGLVFIIFDDLDRLRGEDVLKVLSLLSSLRHLSFVRIIIPADIDIVAEILRAIEIPKPEKYIEKYLPEQISVSIDLGYATAESVVLTMLGSNGIDTDEGCCPIWAAIIINMLADILKKETNSLADHRGDWLFETYNGNPNSVGWITYRMLKSAPEFMISRSGNTLSRTMSIKKKYYFDIKYNSIQNFENIIHALRFSKGRGAVEDNFSYEEYSTLVSSWIFEYAERHWSEFGFTMRKALDSLSKLKPVFGDIPETAEGAFALSYNQFFPNKKITLAGSNKLGEK